MVVMMEEEEVLQAGFVLMGAVVTMTSTQTIGFFFLPRRNIESTVIIHRLWACMG